ncbi:hypothetical protein ACFYS8_18405 [Kitasatospora sp. NPDC004615]|uniref:hypothetical protein n=1 Tax=Kitasatospora sp. NPDC004615 TaxID=3364017 RepID=UPI0036AD42FF
MMTGLVGLLLGPVALGTVPAACLGRYLGRNGEWLALDIAFGGGIVVLPLVAAVLGTWSADEFTAWRWAMAVAGTVLYALPLLIAGEVAARAARKRH